MNTRSSLTPLLCLAGAVLLWGTSFVATKCALAGFTPGALIFLRMLLASAIMALFWRRVPPVQGGRASGDLRWLALLCLLQPCLYFLLEANAVRLTTSAQAGMVSALVPLLVAAGAWIFLREALSGRMVAGLALSLAGVIWLSLSGDAAEAAPNPALGNLLELLAMCCASGYMLVLKHLSSRYDSWRLTGLQVFAGALFFSPWALASSPAQWLAAPASAWLAVGYLGGVVTLGAFGMYNMAASRLAAARAAASINLVPLMAVLSGWALLGESLNAQQGLACALILAGVALGQGPGRPSARR
jgi:drug/metabolite transporter (DMT)-like permease